MEQKAAIAMFITACRSRGLSAKTLEVYQRNLRRLETFAEQHGNLCIETITPNLLRELLAGMRDEHARYHFSKSPSRKTLSPYTIHQAYRTLRTLFIWLVREEIITHNPMLKVDPPRVPKHLVERLDLNQANQLINAIKYTAQPARNLAIVALMLDSGLRVGEVVGLEIEKIDLEKGKARVIGKGDKEREVPLSPVTCRALEKWLWVRGENPSRLVFLSRSGGPLKNNPVLLMLKRLKTKLGWNSLYSHLLRHTFAKLFMEEEGDLKTLQVILGHSSIETTAQIYLDPDFDDLKRKHSRSSPLTQLEEK